MIRHDATGKCLRYSGSAGTSSNGKGQAVLSSCDEKDDRQFWNPGNRGGANIGGRCCSGLRAWNTDQCLSHVSGSQIETGVCDVSGRNYNQKWAMKDGVLKWRKQCVKASATSLFGGAVSGDGDCAGGGDSAWSKQGEREPVETRLYKQAQEENPQMFAKLAQHMVSLGLGASRYPDKCGADGTHCSLVFLDGTDTCLDGDMVFVTERSTCVPVVHDKSNNVLRDPSAMDKCLDRLDGDAKTWGWYQCHFGHSQALRMRDGNGMCNAFGECLYLQGIRV